jgi:hypothetical protein
MTDASSNKDLDSTQIELESRYRTKFPGFDPATWAAMAYYSKGCSYEDVRLLLAKRLGDSSIIKRDALIREAREAGSSVYNPNPSPDPIFQIKDVTDKVPTITE